MSRISGEHTPIGLVRIKEISSVNCGIGGNCKKQTRLLEMSELASGYEGSFQDGRLSRFGPRPWLALALVLEEALKRN